MARSSPMRRIRQCSLGTIAICLIMLASVLRAAELPTTLTDQEFLQIITEFSETGGSFQPQLMTNEDSLQTVIPALKQKIRSGGVYLGVGTEQNFTYISALQPRIAFVFDIRRDNMLEHLMYKGLFELSSDRADFVSRLFSRRRPAALDGQSSAAALFEAYRVVEADSQLYEEDLRAVLDTLLVKHKMQLSESDKTQIASFLNAFRLAGPFVLKGTGDKNLSYAQSMAGNDPAGRNQSYLASEESFKLVQDLERRNLIVPLVGDFAGSKAIASVGRYLRDHDATVDVFYVSNVERYLWEQGEQARQFYSNVDSLPLNASSTFVRSVTVDISRRLGIAIPPGPANWRSFASSVTDFLKALHEGRIQSYREIFEMQ
jgi:hypothetical protein